MMAHIGSPSTQVQGQLELLGEPHLKKTNKQKKNPKHNNNKKHSVVIV
jgi:hypothetical protein